MNNMNSNSGKATETPAKTESLWLLDRADELMRAIALTAWLSVASVFRLARALLARDSIARIAALLANRRILPPTFGLLVAAVVSSITFGYIRISTYTPLDLLSKLSSASAENWLLVAGPGLVSLWFTAFVLGRVLSAVSDRHAVDASALLMHAMSTFTIIGCVIRATSEWVMDFAYEFAYGLLLVAYPLFLTLFLLLGATLAIVGWRAGQQVISRSSATRWRRFLLVYLLAPFAFVAAVPAAFTMQGWLSAVVIPTFAEKLKLPVEVFDPHLHAYGHECYGVGDSFVCQLVLASAHDVIVGSLDKVVLEIRNTQHPEVEKEVVLLASLDQVEQRSPRVEVGTFWKLQGKEATAVAFQIPKEHACRLLERDAETSVGARFNRISFRVAWYPGIGSLRNPSKRFYTSSDAVSEAFLAELPDVCRGDKSSTSRKPIGSQ
jgi:hypothetical protein